MFQSVRSSAVEKAKKEARLILYNKIMEKSTILFLALCGLVAIAFSIPTKKNPFAAEPCDVNACQLPDCYCSSQQTPGGHDPVNVPQVCGVNYLNKYIK